MDNPRLLVRSQTRRDERTARGLAPSPIKVTVTRRAELDPRAHFFTAGDVEKLVYCPSPRVPDARARLGAVAAVVDGGQPVEMRRVSERPCVPAECERLMVEGGGKVHTQFLTDNLVDELQLVVAPFFVGDSRAPRFVRDGCFPWNPGRRATLAEVSQIGDVVLLRYALSSRFETGQEPAAELPAAGCDPKALRKRSRNALIGHTGAVGAGRMPSSQPHPEIRSSTAGSWAMTETGTSWLASVTR